MDTRSTRPVTAPTTGRVDPIAGWLLMVAALAMLLVIVGGFVRLSRAGLSVVEWDVVTGVVPPIGQDAWEESFTSYQQTPEYLLVNTGMTLDEYRSIFFLEWAHRLVARIAGLLVVIPLIVFMVRGLLRPRESVKYWGIAVLFAGQGAIGWFMVASGLDDRPVVSHVRLAIHLLAALTLVAMCLWMALDRLATTTPDPAPLRSQRLVALVWAMTAATVIQIGLGGLVAGLKAGHLSDTWPLMGGQLVPAGVFGDGGTRLASILEPLTSYWVHRWFAFVVAVLVVAVAVTVRRVADEDQVLTVATRWVMGLVAVQITLGVLTVVLGVPTWTALAHQGVGFVLFSALLVVAHGVMRAARTEHSISTQRASTPEGFG